MFKTQALSNMVTTKHIEWLLNAWNAASRNWVCYEVKHAALFKDLVQKKRI